MNKLVFAAAIAIWAVMAEALPAHAEGSKELEALHGKIGALEAGQKAIREELQAIRELLEQAMRPRQRQAATEEVTLRLKGLGDDPTKGDPQAPLMLVEFSDYQCPFCRRHFMTTLPQLERDYIARGKVKYVFRDFPIESLHPEAFKAALAANCAGDQEQYWSMHDRLFGSPNELAPKALAGHAEALGLNLAAFTECLTNERHAEEVRQDMADGRAAGITGTPTFFLAVEAIEPGVARTLIRIRGAQPYSVFKSAIDEALGELVRSGESG